MIQRKQTRFIRKILYTLKRGYGFTITLHKITDETRDYESGKLTTTIVTKKIKRAIILPATIRRQYEQTSPGFKYGGLFDTGTRQIIIDATDLDNYVIEVDDYIIWNGKRWQVAEIQILEYQTAYVISVRMVEGVIRHMVEEIAIETNLQLISELS